MRPPMKRIHVYPSDWKGTGSPSVGARRPAVAVFGSNAPNEPVSARNSFVHGIPPSGFSGLNIFARMGCDQNNALPIASTWLYKPCTRRRDGGLGPLDTTRERRAQTHASQWERFVPITPQSR